MRQMSYDMRDGRLYDQAVTNFISILSPARHLIARRGRKVKLSLAARAKNLLKALSFWS
jgi:hypothetical protein